MAEAKATKGSKAAAARTERPRGKPRAKKLTWRKVKLELPAEFPEKLMTQFQIDVVLAEEGGQENQLPAYRMLVTMIGVEQLAQIRSHLNSEQDVADLLEAIFGKYGLTLGESAASQAS